MRIIEHLRATLDINFVDPTGHIPLPLALAIIGAGSAFAGNIIGQLLANRGNWNCIKWNDALIAAAFGFGAGFLSPWVAMTWPGAIGLGVGANVGQYLATQWYHGDSWSGRDIAWSIGTGAIGGLVGGRISPPTTLLFEEISTSWTRWHARGLNNHAWTGANISRANFVRNFGAATTASSPNRLNAGCACP